MITDWILGKFANLKSTAFLAMLMLTVLASLTAAMLYYKSEAAQAAVKVTHLKADVQRYTDALKQSQEALSQARASAKLLEDTLVAQKAKEDQIRKDAEKIKRISDEKLAKLEEKLKAYTGGAITIQLTDTNGQVISGEAVKIVQEMHEVKITSIWQTWCAFNSHDHCNSVDLKLEAPATPSTNPGGLAVKTALLEHSVADVTGSP